MSLLRRSTLQTWVLLSHKSEGVSEWERPHMLDLSLVQCKWGLVHVFLIFETQAFRQSCVLRWERTCQVTHCKLSYMRGKPSPTLITLQSSEWSLIAESWQPTWLDNISCCSCTSLIGRLRSLIQAAITYPSMAGLSCPMEKGNVFPSTKGDDNLWSQLNSFVESQLLDELEFGLCAQSSSTAPLTFWHTYIQDSRNCHPFANFRCEALLSPKYD